MWDLKVGKGSTEKRGGRFENEGWPNLDLIDSIIRTQYGGRDR